MSGPFRLRRSTVWLALCASLACAPAAPARAQTADDAAAAQRTLRPPPAPRRSTLGARGFVAFDLDFLAATDTFNAVLGTARLTAVGGGGDLIGIWKGLFLRVEATSATKTGSRVVVSDGAATSLGIPLTVEMTPVECGVGWRKRLDRRDRVSVYAGGGWLHLIYRETSTFAASGDDTDTTFNGGFAMAGVDVRVWRVLMAGVEGQARYLPNAIGQAGASAAFGEKNLGGNTVRAMLGVRF